MAHCNLKQGPEGLKVIIEDLISEGVIIPTASSFNISVWPVLKPGKNKWNEFISALALSIKTPVANTDYWND